MPTAPHPFDTLPVVSDPGVSAANGAPAHVITVGDVVAALADEAAAVSDSEAEADALTAAAVFGLQWSFKRRTLPAAPGASTTASSDASSDASSTASSDASSDASDGRAA